MAAMNKMLGQHLRGLHVIRSKGIGFVEIAGARRKHQRYAFLRRALTHSLPTPDAPATITPSTPCVSSKSSPRAVAPVRAHRGAGKPFAPALQAPRSARRSVLHKTATRDRERSALSPRFAHRAAPTPAITHKAQLLNGLVDALTRCRRDAPLPA